MTHNEYEQAKRRLEESRRAGVELVESSYRAQMAALEMVWKLMGGAPTDAPQAAETPAPAAPAATVPTPPPPAERKRRAGGEVKEELRRIYPRLPETFGRADIHTLLGYEPERAGLYRALQDLSTTGALTLVRVSLGRTPALYRKIAAELPT
jgi:hypothetical protein